ncbi:MAG TPA: hypothetical protein VNN22_02670 [Verrucomicrobiae bacterium]|nr:hypothetical protein [Verrucomicrobiae bacterium]
MRIRDLPKLFFPIICLIGFSSLAVTNNVSCNYAAITNALATANEGDTVLIGPGDCVINNSILINRNISFTIAGSGTNLTTLRSANGLGAMIWVITSSTNVFVMRDLNIVGATGNGQGGCLMFGHPAYDFAGMFRIYNIQMTNVIGRGITAGAGRTHNSYGLIDHCNFVAAPGYAQMFSPEGAVANAWTNSNPIGTLNVLCIEDCTMKTTAEGNGYFDSYNGAQVVFRHNFCDGYSPIGGHGYDSGDSSIRTWEVYENVFTNWGNGAAFAVWRGGSGVMFSNKVYGGIIGTFIGLGYYRACPFQHPYPSVTGCLPLGVPGDPYIINFNGTTNYPLGEGQTFSGNPTDGQYAALGFSTYYFKTSIIGLPYGGNRYVKIGATAAQTLTNLYNAVNLGPGAGVTYTNANMLPFTFGHEFIATGLNATTLYLRNALDGTNAFGYPANQQEGVVISYPLTATNFVNNPVVWPMYFWGNTLNGLPRNFDDFVTAPECAINLINLVKAGRDYFNNTIPAASVYKPLVYPHPLQTLAGGSGSTPPTIVLPPSSLVAIPPR